MLAQVLIGDINTEDMPQLPVSEEKKKKKRMWKRLSWYRDYTTLYGAGDVIRSRRSSDLLVELSHLVTAHTPALSQWWAVHELMKLSTMEMWAITLWALIFTPSQKGKLTGGSAAFSRYPSQAPPLLRICKASYHLSLISRTESSFYLLVRTSRNDRKHLGEEHASYRQF